MAENDKQKLLDNLVDVILFPESIRDLLNLKLQGKPAGSEAVIKPPSKESTAGYTAKIEQSHPGVPPLTIAAETRAELDEKIKKAGLEEKTMIITKNTPDK